MAKEVTDAARNDETEKRAALFSAIGEFIFEFSQLEFTMRHVLGLGLRLNDNTLFDAVTSPYDFAALCRVTKILLQETSNDNKLNAKIETTFNGCLAMNDERVRIAHGTWTIDGGARHVSRNTLKAKSHFEKPEFIVTKAREVSELRSQIVEIMLGEREEWPAIAKRLRK